jgi:hypothetical protein
MHKARGREQIDTPGLQNVQKAQKTGGNRASRRSCTILSEVQTARALTTDTQVSLDRSQRSF